MTAADRQLDPRIASWLAEGVDIAPAGTRRAISAAARATRQRRYASPVDLARQARWLAIAALLIAAVALAISGWGFRPAPTPTPVATSAPAATATLHRADRDIAFSYLLDPGLGLHRVDITEPVGFIAFVSPNGDDWTLDGPSPVFDAGSHGVGVADVTGALEHGSTVFRPLFGATARAFLAGLDASDYFVVRDIQPATVGGLPGWSARVTTEGEWWSHIDVSGPGLRAGSVEFGASNVTFVTDVGNAVVLIEVWAADAQTLADWLPRAMPFVSSIRFDQPKNP